MTHLESYSTTLKHTRDQAHFAQTHCITFLLLRSCRLPRIHQKWARSSLSQTSVPSHMLFPVPGKPFLLSWHVWLPYILPNLTSLLGILPFSFTCFPCMASVSEFFSLNSVCFQLCEFLQLISRDMSAWALLPLPLVPSKQRGRSLSEHDPANG